MNGGITSRGDVTTSRLAAGGSRGGWWGTNISNQHFPNYMSENWDLPGVGSKGDAHNPTFQPPFYMF